MSGKRILLVDDSKTQLMVLQKVFKEEGFDILSAENGLEGVSQAFMKKPDIIISDILMPELNGYQLCRLLKNDKQTSHIPIILRTSLDQKQDQFWGIRAGADRYIIKSSDFSGLKNAVAELLSKAVRCVEDNRQTKQNNLNYRSIRSSVNKLLDKLLFESTLSSEARQLSDYITNKESLFKEAVELINSLVDYSCFCICLFSGDETRLYFDLKHPLGEAEIERTKVYLFTSFIDKSRKKKNVETFFIRDSLEIDNGSINEIVSRLTVPLNIHNECIGHLSFHAKNHNSFTLESENTINLLANDFSMVFKLLLLYDETKKLSITDDLTSLYNKRYFMDHFEKEFARAKRFNSNLSLIIVDIDHFKAINDTYGHLQGDSILKEMGALLKNNVRKVDLPARYGGEEFAVIAPNINLNGTGFMAEKLRNLVEATSFKGERKSLRVTISLGAAMLKGNVNDKLELIKSADDALYQAKHEGRNRVCLAK